MTPHWLHHRLVAHAGRRQRRGKSTPLTYLMSAYGVRVGWRIWKERNEGLIWRLHQQDRREL